MSKETKEELKPCIRCGSNDSCCQLLTKDDWNTRPDTNPTNPWKYIDEVGLPEGRRDTFIVSVQIPGAAAFTEEVMFKIDHWEYLYDGCIYAWRDRPQPAEIKNKETKEELRNGYAKENSICDV